MSLPASVEMPAGTGKTQIVAGMAAAASARSQKTLVLTHTNAGVDAIRKRLRKFGVPNHDVHVDTITGWAFDLVRSYPALAGIEVPSAPDWERSEEYIHGAAHVVSAEAIKSMHRASFDYLLVDEYQDCVKGQHKFICAIQSAIPATLLIGDRLQGIFGFSGSLIDWDSDVISVFLPHDVPVKSWRWANHNEVLGEWLLGIRSELVAGGSLDFSKVNIHGLRWLKSDIKEICKVAYSFKTGNGSVVIIGKYDHDIIPIAERLNGKYVIMEDIRGRFMHKFLDELVNSDSCDFASLLAEFAKKCFIGLSGIDQPVMRKLKAGNIAANLKRDEIKEVLAVLDIINQNPSLSAVEDAMIKIGDCKALRLYRREAWWDTQRSIASVVADSSLSGTDALARVRDRVRHAGRLPQSRVISRTVLIKGLEYDHAIVVNAETLDQRDLYVALTRARKTVTVFSKSSLLRFK